MGYKSRDVGSESNANNQFSMHQDARSIDAIAKMLLDLPRKDGDNLNHMQFDPDGDQFTVACNCTCAPMDVTYN